MFLDTGNVPYSFYNLLVDDYLIIDSGHTHRPDRIVCGYNGGGLAYEMLCNKASNVSPLSAVVNTEYLLPNRVFVRHFGG